LLVILGAACLIFKIKHSIMYRDTSNIKLTHRDASESLCGTLRHKLVIIFAYERTGSTFLGDIFNNDKEVFYFYEPFRPKHSKWPYPRELDTFERYKYVSNIIGHVMRCELDKFPKDLPIMQDGYLAIKSANIRRIAECYSKKENISQCIHLSRKACNAKTIIVSKTVRSTMESIGHLLSKYRKCASKVKVIHLVRDPRGMLNSRKTSAHLNMDQLTAEANTLCKRMHKDVLIFKQIKEIFPDSILQLRYEDLAEHPQETTSNIYRYLQMEYTNEINSFVAGRTLNKGAAENQYGTKRRDSNATAYAWKKTISYNLVKSVDPVCYSLYKELGYLPIQSEKELRDKALVHRQNAPFTSI
ncbi:unnamed protein product, partial [Owenia fusiformis]